MSAPISPGGLIRPSDTTSVTTTTSSAPAAWQASASLAKSRTWPKKLGFCTTTQEVSLSMPAIRSSRPSTSGLPTLGVEAFPARGGLDDAAIMRMQAAGDQRLVAPRHAIGHQHGFGGARRAVIHRGVGHLHGRQQRHLGLELEEVLQSALRDLGLVRRVGRQELAALDHVVDGRRHVMAIGPGADEERRRRGRHVLRRIGLEGALDLELALVIGQAGDLGAEPRRGRHVAEQLVDRFGADLGQHLAAVGIGEGKVAHQPRLFTKVL